MVVGAVEFTTRLGPRTRYLTLNPPRECLYLSNLAVRPDFRRRGIATRLLDAAGVCGLPLPCPSVNPGANAPVPCPSTPAEMLGAISGESVCYLHNRLKDEAAVQLYRARGYEVEHTDNWASPFLGIDRRYLMRRQIAPPEGRGLRP